jgi:hypothetical protein
MEPAAKMASVSATITGVLACLTCPVTVLSVFAHMSLLGLISQTRSVNFTSMLNALTEVSVIVNLVSANASQDMKVKPAKEQLVQMIAPVTEDVCTFKIFHTPPLHKTLSTLVVLS